MKKLNLQQLIFMALCCDLGLFGKRLIAPAANLITDNLHIPGGISTAFSLMFVVIAAMMTERFGCAALMGAVQSVLAVAFGMTGSMGALAPIGYIVPGIIIDLTLLFFRRKGKTSPAATVPANILASLAACLTADIIVFRLTGLPLLMYASVACTGGAICGVLAMVLTERLKPVLFNRGTL